MIDAGLDMRFNVIRCLLHNVTQGHFLPGCSTKKEKISEGRNIVHGPANCFSSRVRFVAACQRVRAGNGIGNEDIYNIFKS